LQVLGRHVTASRANSLCPSCASWLIFTPFDELGTKNSRATRTNDGSRTASSFGVSCTRHCHSKNLAGSAVCGRPARGERLLLRRGSPPPHFARRLQKDRGRDEKRNQGEPSVRKNRSFKRRSARTRQAGPARRTRRTSRAQQIQTRHHREHSA